MDLGLDGRVVIVTGGASNLGRAITLGFAHEGARVVIADVDGTQAKKVEAEAPSGTITSRHTDVTDRDSVQATVQYVESSMGRIDVLVNCAGWTIDRLFMEKPRDEWEKEIAIDMWGFINSVRAVLDGMVKRKYGRIVSIGSDAGRRTGQRRHESDLYLVGRVRRSTQREQQCDCQPGCHGSSRVLIEFALSVAQPLRLFTSRP